MTEIVYTLFAILYIYGLHNLFDYETNLKGEYDPKSSMLLGWIAFKLDKKLGLPFTKPLYACMPCMASLHGIIFYLITPMQLPYELIVLWIIALSGAMKLISKL